ncbi:MAG TPA: permease prefix domain 1-containing protein, partial [Pirellulaceae bacterium]|nr:permease prefix domain 1-containing protein [Pirellulaceae bacterium]
LRQRGAIAEELRSHLEDRLDELMARGISRDEAVKQALAEFGDAAGLAGQFVAISWNRKRRWLMRLTTFSVAATLLLAASLVIFWPGRNAAPGLAKVEAQARDQRDPFAPPPPPENDGAKKAKPTSRKSAGMVIEEKLNQTTTLDVVEMPLKDVVEYLQETHQFPIVLKLKMLDGASISPDTPITKSLRGIRLATALDLILDDLELTYYITEVLVITTPADAQSRTEVRIYDCRDIIAMPMPGRIPSAEGTAPKPSGSTAVHDRRAEQLMNIITTNVDQPSWSNASDKFPGNGSLSEFNGLIVITQTAQTHRKIEHVLNMLREAAGLEISSAGAVVR